MRCEIRFVEPLTERHKTFAWQDGRGLEHKHSARYCVKEQRFSPSHPPSPHPFTEALSVYLRVSHLSCSSSIWIWIFRSACLVRRAISASISSALLFCADDWPNSLSAHARENRVRNGMQGMRVDRVKKGHRPALTCAKFHETST